MFKKKYGIGTIAFFVAVFSVFTFLFTAVSLNSYYKTRETDFYGDKSYIAKMSRIDDIIRSSFFFDIDDEQLEDMMIKGYIEGLGDQFTYYLNPSEAELYSQASNGEIIGIGIYATYDSEADSIYVTNVMAGSPAEKAGLVAGDLITKVGDLDVTQATYYEAIYSVPGKAGTDVTVTVSRYPNYETEEALTLTREKITINSVSYEMLDNNIAYIKINEFNDNTDEQFNELLKQAKTEGAENIMFDVRNNPGGNLETVCNILDELLPSGPIVHIVDKDNNIVQTINSDARETDLPMVVLINRNTASGGELFCSALRDYEKATLLGETTFGKGCMQSVRPLDDGSLLVFTTNLYNPPYGENYHGIGVDPHVEVVMTDEMMKIFSKLTRDEDIQFQAALNEIAKLTDK
ncbi:MAG: hypothetical protein A2Y17_11655 [Clostridiales bacterium GWF2_38_85]|nr:MAG: hypothetical protein A2Y17_11655 [Clostridiales bacterium GWF2_38_85]HBL85357.1 hypothetical protein [Clostridiales bacterium]